MLYNIAMKVRELPQKSKSGEEVWDELLEICDECSGIDLLVNLEDYMVRWIDRNLEEIYGKKIKTIIETRDESCNQTPKR